MVHVPPDGPPDNPAALPAVTLIAQRQPRGDSPAPRSAMDSAPRTDEVANSGTHRLVISGSMPRGGDALPEITLEATRVEGDLHALMAAASDRSAVVPRLEPQLPSISIQAVRHSPPTPGDTQSE